MIDECFQHTAALLLGGNEGDVASLLRRAAHEVGYRCGRVVAASRLYRTPPWGFVSANDFLNQALVVGTALPPEQLLAELLAIEHDLGRRRSAHQAVDEEGKRQYADRPIDIDIIFYDSLVLHSATLDLPHPRAHLRRFVLAPLAELIPSYVHPLLQRSVADLLASCPDISEIHPLEPTAAEDES